jgi:hypothetical protein
MAEIGQTLREARMRARIDISEVEARTKIRAKYLRAIENEEWDLLPGPVYVKSFLRTYGDYLGLDSRLLIDEFRRRYERPADQDLRPMSSLTRERERASRGPVVSPRLVIGLVLVAVVAALYAIGSGSGGPSRPNPAGAVGAGRHHRPPRHGAATTTTGTKTVAITHPAAAVKLKLVATGPVYVCVEDRAGKRLIPGVTYAVGQAIPTETSGELLVTLGNNAVRMQVNGKPYQVAASANAIGLKITTAGVKPLAAGHAPTCA